MTVRDEFLFIAGDPALDFLNTEIVRDGERVDLLDGAEALERWMREAKLGRVRVTPVALKRARRLRAALRELVEEVARRPLAGRSTGGSPVFRAINDELRRGRGALALHVHDGRFELNFQPDEDDPRFLLARVAATFLATADPARIRRCGGTNCILYFYDTTKSGTRRWCSMAGCGNRMKAALHYQRTRPSS